MSITGWYYLHTNGSLIYKRDSDYAAADIRESPFARAMWPVDVADREGAWSILIEALSIGADKRRVLELAQHWKCDDSDADNYAAAIGLTIYKDGDAWCATSKEATNIQEYEAGFGQTKLEAVSDLCKRLGYGGGKLGWHASFKRLVSDSAAKSRAALSAAKEAQQ